MVAYGNLLAGGGKILRSNSRAAALPRERSAIVGALEKGRLARQATRDRAGRTLERNKDVAHLGSGGRGSSINGSSGNVFTRIAGAGLRKARGRPKRGALSSLGIVLGDSGLHAVCDRL